jgi:hypothetical protein
MISHDLNFLKDLLTLTTYILLDAQTRTQDLIVLNGQKLFTN